MSSDLSSASNGVAQAADFQQDQGGYENMAQGQEDMGGGNGAMGSGVAGGHEGNSSATSQPEKQDWLDKGIKFAGKKMGINVSDQNADKVGDFANKEYKQHEGCDLPGVK